MEIQKIKQVVNTPEGRELVNLIDRSILDIDKCGDISLNNSEEIAVEVKARKLAVNKLKDLFSMLISSQDYDIISGNVNEYTVVPENSTTWSADKNSTEEANK